MAASMPSESNSSPRTQMATPVPSESNSSPRTQTVIFMPVSEPSTNHQINHTYSNPQAMYSCIVQQNPETSTINHGIPPPSNSEPKPMFVMSTNTDSSEYSVIPPGFVQTNQAALSSPLYIQSLNGSDIAGNKQVVYDHRCLQQANSWPQANQPRLQNEEGPSREKEHPEPNPQEVVFPQAVSYILQQSPETSTINHGIPIPSNSEPKPMLVMSPNIDSSEYSVIPPGCVQTNQPALSSPLYTQPLNVSDIAGDNQVVYDHRCLQQANSWPQENQPPLQNQEGLSREKEHPEPPPQEVVNPQAVSHILQQNPETSISHGIRSNIDPKSIIMIPTNTDIPEGSIIPPGSVQTHQPTPSSPRHTQSLNIPNTPRDPQVPYMHANSWPQANQPHLQKQEQPPSIDHAPAASGWRLKQRAGGHVANTAGNLANLLPTGTVLAFQALIPSLSNSGKCQSANKYLVGCAIACCAVACFISSFTDSYMHMVDGDQGKLYYGFVTRKGLWVLNGDGEEERIKELRHERYKVKVKDYVHAVGSLLVFMVFAVGSLEVAECFFAGAEEEYSQVFIYLPLVAGVLASCFFTVCPTTRRGIGYAGL